MIRRPPRSTLSSSSAASDVYKRQVVVSAHRPVLQQSEPHVGPVVLSTLLLKECLQSDVAAMQRVRVCRPALPDAGVAVCGSDITPPGLLVVDDVDALHAL